MAKLIIPHGRYINKIVNQTYQAIQVPSATYHYATTSISIDLFGVFMFLLHGLLDFRIAPVWYFMTSPQAILAIQISHMAAHTWCKNWTYQHDPVIQVYLCISSKMCLCKYTMTYRNSNVVIAKWIWNDQRNVLISTIGFAISLHKKTTFKHQLSNYISISSSSFFD